MQARQVELHLHRGLRQFNKYNHLKSLTIGKTLRCTRKTRLLTESLNTSAFHSQTCVANSFAVCSNLSLELLRCVYMDTPLSFIARSDPPQLSDSLDPFCLLALESRSEHNDLTSMQTLGAEAFLHVSYSEVYFIFGNLIFRTEYK